MVRPASADGGVKGKEKQTKRREKNEEKRPAEKERRKKRKKNEKNHDKTSKWFKKEEVHSGRPPGTSQNMARSKNLQI